MPKKISEMTGNELVRQHAENLTVLDNLNKKNLKKACSEIFYMQPLYDFFANGVLANAADKKVAYQTADRILKDPSTEGDFRKIMELETKAAKVMELGCKVQEAGDLTTEEWRELKEQSKDIAILAATLSKSGNINKFNRTSKKPIKDQVSPNKAGTDIFTVACMTESYAACAELGVAKEGCQIQAIATAMDGRIAAYVEKCKKSQYLDNGVKYQQAQQMQAEFDGIKNGKLAGKTDEEILAYANSVEAFVQKYSDTEPAAFAKDHPYFKEAKAFYGKKDILNEKNAGEEIDLGEDKIVDINNMSLDDLANEKEEDEVTDENDPLGMTKKDKGFVYNPELGVYTYHRVAKPGPEWSKHEIVDLNGLDSSEANKKREEINFNVDGMPADAEKSVVLYGMMEGWRNKMIQDLDKFRELLEDTQNNPGANFGNRNQEGPDDYKRLTLAVKECRDKLEDKDATLGSIISAFTNLKSREDTYVSKHTPRFIGHRTEQTAQRFKIVQSMSELTKVHNTLLKDTAAKLKANVAVVEQDKIANLYKNTDLMNMTLAGIKDRVSLGPDAIVDDFSEHELEDDRAKLLTQLGIAAMESHKAKAEKKMLTDRFVRKTGLDSKQKRDDFDPYDNVRNLEQCAKNYLANKYLERLDKTDMPVEEVIDLNERIREKPFKHELESLCGDKYFLMIVRRNPDNWVEKWTKVDEEAEEYKETVNEKVERYSGDIGVELLTNKISSALHPEMSIEEMAADPEDLEERLKIAKTKPTIRERLINSHAILGKHLLNLALKKPENEDLLRVVSMTEDKGRLYRDIAEYILYTSARLPADKDKLKDAVNSRVNNKELILGVSNRARNFYDTFVFSKQQKEAGVKKADANKNDAKKVSGNNHNAEAGSGNDKQNGSQNDKNTKSPVKGGPGH